MIKPILIMGNGPSLKLLDFNKIKIDSFGMNLACRYYKNMNFYPTYWGCFDIAVTENHKEEFKKFIEESSNKLKKAFTINKDVLENKKAIFINLIRKELFKFGKNRKEFLDIGNTGGNCCQLSIDMGYNKIILIGVECDYKVEILKESKVVIGNRLVIKETPKKNPNYAWDDYQRNGDIYNKPNADIFHLPAWKALKEFSQKEGIDIVNCSPYSKLDFFRKSTLEEEGVYSG